MAIDQRLIASAVVIAQDGPYQLKMWVVPYFNSGKHWTLKLIAPDGREMSVGTGVYTTKVHALESFWYHMGYYDALSHINKLAFKPGLATAEIKV